MSSVMTPQMYPPPGHLSVPVSPDAADFASSSVAETQVMPSSVTAVLSSVTPGALLDASFPITANKNTPSLAVRGPGLLTSYSLDLSAQPSLFPDGEPASFSQRESASIWDFTSSFFSTPPLEFSSWVSPSSEVLASPPPRSGDLSTFISQAFSTLVATLSLTNSVSSRSPQLFVPNSTNLDFSQLWPSSDLPLSSFTFLPSYSEMSLQSSFPSSSPKFSEAPTVSPTDAEAHFTSAFTATTSYFEFSLMSHESAVTTLVPSSSEPILTAETHLTSLLTAVPTTPVLTESSVFSTLIPSDGGISTMNDPTSILPSFSEVIPVTTVLVSTGYLPSASSFLPEVIRSPLPTEPGGTRGPSFTPTDLPRNTSTQLSTSDTSAGPENSLHITLNSRTVGQNRHEGSTVLAPPSLHPATTPAPEATVHTPVLVTTKSPYVCDITVPDAYLITTGKALLHITSLGWGDLPKVFIRNAYVMYGIVAKSVAFGPRRLLGCSPSSLLCQLP